MKPLDSESRQTALNLIAQFKDAPGALLPILHGIQDGARVRAGRDGSLDRRRAESVARRRPRRHQLLSLLSRHAARPAHRAPMPGRSVPVDGRATPRSAAKQRLGIDFHQTTADGKFSLEPVYCLGNCACSPAVMIDGEIYGRVDAASVRRSACPSGSVSDDGYGIRAARRRRRFAGRRAKSRRRSRDEAARAANRRPHRPQRLTRHVLAGAAGRSAYP